MSFALPVLLSAEHQAEDFNCGNDSLNLYLKRFALTNTASGSTRTYVATAYAQFGFPPSPTDPHHLMLLMKDLIHALARRLINTVASARCQEAPGSLQPFQRFAPEGERKNPRQPVDESSGVPMLERRPHLLPLPGGGGRGKGEPPSDK